MLPDDIELKSQVKWEHGPEMIEGRHSFCAITLGKDRYVYVYGGITGNQPNSHRPKIVENVIERLDVVKESEGWIKFEINDAPRLAAFGWS